MIEMDHFYVAELSKEQIIAGFIVFGIYSLKTAHIMILAVHPDFQRRNIGSKLLQHALNLIRNEYVTKIRLEVRTDNAAAIHFYEHFDFKNIGEIDGYYDDGSNAYLMVHELDYEKKKE